MSDGSIELRLLQALSTFRDARATALTRARTALGLGELDAKALLYLLGHPGTRPSTLRAYLGLTSAGVTTLVDRLIDRGAVAREVDPADRRATLLRVIIDPNAEPWNALTQFDTDVAAVLGECSPAEQESLAALLERAAEAGTGESATARRSPSSSLLV